MVHKLKDHIGEVRHRGTTIGHREQQGQAGVARFDAKLEAKEANGITSFELACTYGHEHVASFLLDRYAWASTRSTTTKCLPSRSLIIRATIYVA